MSKTLTRADLMVNLQHRFGISRYQAKRLIDDVFNLIKLELQAGSAVKLSGLGVLNVREKKARPGRNPKTGEAVLIPERRVISFHPSRTLKNKLAELIVKE